MNSYYNYDKLDYTRNVDYKTEIGSMIRYVETICRFDSIPYDVFEDDYGHRWASIFKWSNNKEWDDKVTKQFKEVYGLNKTNKKWEELKKLPSYSDKFKEYKDKYVGILHIHEEDNIYGILPYGFAEPDYGYTPNSRVTDLFPDFFQIKSIYPGGNHFITQVILPPSIEVISTRAFQKCNNLTVLKFENSNKSKLRIIDDCAFSSCNLCKRIIIPNNCYLIGKSAFSNNYITSVRLPENLEIIDNNAFDYCERLNSIKIPEKVTYIGSGAFYKTKSLKKVEISNSIEYIGEHTFYESGIRRLEINSDRLRYIGNSAFLGTYGLKEVILNCPNLIELGKGIFSKSINLVRVDISNTCISKIYDGMFEGCEKIREVKLPDTLTEIGKRAFRNNLDLQEIILPPHIKIIKESAFDSNTSLVDIKLPDELETIEEYVFYQCSLQEINIPNSCVNIGNSAFRNNPLEVVKLPDNLDCRLFGGINNERYSAVFLNSFDRGDIEFLESRHGKLKTAVIESVTPLFKMSKKLFLRIKFEGNDCFPEKYEIIE